MKRDSNPAAVAFVLLVWTVLLLLVADNVYKNVIENYGSFRFDFKSVDEISHGNP